MFLCDIAEFGRKVKVTKKLTLNEPVTRGYKSGLFEKGLLGAVGVDLPSGNNLDIVRPLGDKSNLSFRGSTNNPKFPPGNDLFHFQQRGSMGGKSKRLVRDHNKRPIRKPNPNVKPTPKSTRKLVNKYTLGAAGILGAGAAGYGGYKLLTRNKKGDKK